MKLETIYHGNKFSWETQLAYKYDPRLSSWISISSNGTSYKLRSLSYLDYSFSLSALYWNASFSNKVDSLIHSVTSFSDRDRQFKYINELCLNFVHYRIV